MKVQFVREDNCTLVQALGITRERLKLLSDKADELGKTKGISHKTVIDEIGTHCNPEQHEWFGFFILYGYAMGLDRAESGRVHFYKNSGSLPECLGISWERMTEFTNLVNDLSEVEGMNEMTMIKMITDQLMPNLNENFVFAYHLGFLRKAINDSDNETAKQQTDNSSPAPVPEHADQPNEVQQGR